MKRITLPSKEITKQAFPSIGRPRVTVTREDVLKLRGERYNWNEVAALLGIGRATAVRLAQKEPCCEGKTFHSSNCPVVR